MLVILIMVWPLVGLDRAATDLLTAITAHIPASANLSAVVCHSVPDNWRGGVFAGPVTTACPQPGRLRVTLL